MGLAAGAPTSTLANPQPWLLDAFGGRPTATGQRVTPDTAMRTTAVFACVNCLSRSAGQLPLRVMRKAKGGGAEEATDHPLYQVLMNGFNPFMTAQDGIELAMNRLNLRGTSFTQIVRDQAGRVIELWPLSPDRIIMRWEANDLVYDFTPASGGTVTFRSDEIWRTIGMSFDGFTGVTPITYAREAIGLSMATEEHGAKLFANGAQMATAFKYPGKLQQEPYDRLKKSLDDRFAGSRNAFKSIILEDNMTVEKLSMTSADAQYIELRKYQLEEICRAFAVPLHKVGNYDRATFNNIEHLSMDFVTGSLQPWLRRFEETGFRDLLSANEQKRYFLRFDTDALLRGDSNTQANVASLLIAARVKNPNEVRAGMNLNPYDGGEVYENPNTTSAKQAGNVVGDKG